MKLAAASDALRFVTESRYRPAGISLGASKVESVIVTASSGRLGRPLATGVAALLARMVLYPLAMATEAISNARRETIRDNGDSPMGRWPLDNTRYRTTARRRPIYR